MTASLYQRGSSPIVVVGGLPMGRGLRLAFGLGSETGSLFRSELRLGAVSTLFRRPAAVFCSLMAGEAS
jgi:hypothetical protein